MPIRLFLLLLFLSAAVLPGCMKVGPDFKKPAAAQPKSWIEAEYATSRPDLPVHAEWWQQLNDPVLNNLVTLARQQNLPLQTAGLRIFEARAQLGVAVGQFYPQTQQGTANLTYTQTSMRSPASPQPGSQGRVQWTFWQDSVGFQAAWELDFWGKFRRGIEAAEANLSASVADYDNALVSLCSDVASTYVLMRVAEERLRIAKTNAALEREAVNIADIRYQLGATSERDVQQAKTLLDSTEATIPQLTDVLQKSFHALCLLLGMPPSDLSELLGQQGRIPVCPDQIGVGIPADLLRRRPDIRQAEYAAAAACAGIGVAKADLFPSFSLTGSVGWLSSSYQKFVLADIFSGKSATASFSPGVTWNLFNYGRIVNNVRAQDARFQQALLTYSNTVLTALKEVEDGISDFQLTKEQSVKLAAAAEAAKRAAELAFLQYRAGQTDFTTVIVAQQTQLSQQDALAQAQGNIVLGMVGLYRALGGGWEIRGQEVVPASVKEEMAKRTYWGGLLKESPEKQADPAKLGPGRYVPDF